MGGNVHKFIDIGPFSYLVGGGTLNNLDFVRKTAKYMFRKTTGRIEI